MTDQLMDARLRAAGEAWRASTEAAPDTTASGEPVDVLAAHPHRPRRLAWLLSAAVVVAALVAAGLWVFVDSRSGDTAPTSAADVSALLGVTWTESGWETSLVRPGFRNSDGPYATTTELRFPDAGHITVTHRCYAESGRVTITGDTIDVTDLVRDRTIKCAAANGTDAANEQWDYRVVDELLSGRPTWSIKDGQLTISDKSTDVTFDSTWLAQLRDATWRLSTITIGREQATSVHAPFTLSYAAPKGMELREPCQEFLLGLTLDRDTVTFNSRRRVGPIFHCGPGTPELHQETAAVDRVLSGTAHWSISGGVLTLTKGGTTLTFTR